MAYDFLYDVQDGVATITLNRPEVLNALTFTVYAQLRDLFEALRYDDAVKVVVLTGAGEGFCSGGDVEEIIGELLKRDMKGHIEFTRMTGAVVQHMRQLEKPILAALNGGLGGRLGSPMAASMILFGLAFLIATAGALMTGSIGQIRFSSDIPFQFYFGGLFVAFYVIAVTFIAPRFGVGNAIFFVLVGQLISAATIDHFGLFGAMVGMYHLF